MTAATTVDPRRADPDAIHVWFPRWVDEAQLGNAARNWVENTYGVRPNGSIKRHIVNMLRHARTNYEANPVAERRAAINDLIAQRFPFLTEEVERQNADRFAAVAAGRPTQPPRHRQPQLIAA